MYLLLSRSLRTSSKSLQPFKKDWKIARLGALPKFKFRATRQLSSATFPFSATITEKAFSSEPLIQSEVDYDNAKAKAAVPSLSSYAATFINDVSDITDSCNISRHLHQRLITGLYRFFPSDFKLLFSPNNHIELYIWTETQKSILMYYFLRHIISEFDALGKVAVLDLLNGLFKMKFRLQKSSTNNLSIEIQHMALYISMKLLNASSLDPSEMHPTLIQIIDHIRNDKSNIHNSKGGQQRFDRLSKKSKSHSKDSNFVDETHLYQTVLMLNLCAELRPSNNGYAPLGSFKGNISTANSSDSRNYLDDVDKSNDLDANLGSSEGSENSIHEVFLPLNLMRDFQFRFSRSFLKANAKTLSNSMFCLRKLGFSFDSLHPQLQSSIHTFLLDNSKQHPFDHYVNCLYNVSIMLADHNRSNEKSTASLNENLNLSEDEANELISKLSGENNNNSSNRLSDKSKEALCRNIFDRSIHEPISFNDQHSRSPYRDSFQKMLISLSIIGIEHKDLVKFGSVRKFESILEQLFDMDIIKENENVGNDMPAILFWLSRIHFKKENIKSELLLSNIREYLKHFSGPLDLKYFSFLLFSIYRFGFKWTDFDEALQNQLRLSISYSIDDCIARLKQHSTNNFDNEELSLKSITGDAYRLIGGLRYLHVPSEGFKAQIFSLLKFNAIFPKENLSNFIHWIASMGLDYQQFNQEERSLLRDIIVRGVPGSNIQEMNSILYGMGRLNVLKFDNENLFSKQDSILIVSSIIRNLLALNSSNFNKSTGVDNYDKYTRKGRSGSKCSNFKYTRESLAILNQLVSKYPSNPDESSSSPSTYYSSFEVHNPSTILNAVSSAMENIEMSVPIEDFASIIHLLSQNDISYDQLSLKAQYYIRTIIMNIVEKNENKLLDVSYQQKLSWLGSRLSYFSVTSLPSIDKYKYNSSNSSITTMRPVPVVEGDGSLQIQSKSKKKFDSVLESIDLNISSIKPDLIVSMTLESVQHSNDDIAKVKSELLGDCFVHISNSIFRIIRSIKVSNPSLENISSVIEPVTLQNMTLFLKTMTFSDFLCNDILANLSNFYGVDVSKLSSYGNLFRWMQSFHY